MYRFDSHHQRSLLEFLKCVGSSYLAQGRATDFVVDLLVLDVPSLFMADHDSTSFMQNDIMTESVSDKFCNFLADYIQRNSLRISILKRAELICVSSKRFADFFMNIICIILLNINY